MAESLHSESAVLSAKHRSASVDIAFLFVIPFLQQPTNESAESYFELGNRNTADERQTDDQINNGDF